MPYKSLEQISFFLKDFKRYKSVSQNWYYLLMETGLYLVFLYRLSRFLFLVKIPIVRILCKLFAIFLMKLSEILFNTLLPPSTDIGPGLYIGHPYGILISHESRIGKNLSIAHHVTIGNRGVGIKGVPTLGDDVFIGSGAKIVGPITIGHKVRIGANSVVLKNVPDRAVVVGNPAKIVKIL